VNYGPSSPNGFDVTSVPEKIAWICHNSTPVPNTPKGYLENRTKFQMLLKTFAALSLIIWAFPVHAQEPPSPGEIARYSGLLAAAAIGDADRIKTLIAAGEKPDVRDEHGRTPLHVAAFRGRHEALRTLAAAGADLNALENDRYDIVTIAAVANDIPTLEIALELGASAKNITSQWDGTALIAAAHLGHAEVVRILIKAGAPLDHINNLGWTAVIESIVLGDGGPRHIDTLRSLVEAGANVNIADRNGETPLTLARARGFTEMVSILERNSVKDSH
jgi:ankyrin repeat protein